ncbi:dimethylmenaquinone methyltransferase [Desulfuromonas versatilis]|uniref:Dimethylmenaquinone methyltransferase n=1 Tax=Desulfuromonas versatilis TaxID=2802975 RepID=A0ABN6DX80_9BACT|nr:TraR/DksA family transcriptional regulator [Desulfuromonas versatilis]BCR04742.1 dimethylmenaquinone methyltransferase [Desulfuromonas versatilis]
MRKQRLEAIGKRLLEHRQELYAEILRKNREAAGLTDEGVPDLADQGLTDNLREFLHLLSDNKREELIKVDEALDRLAAGSYGLCQRCGEPIDIQRLEVRPFTRYDVACKEAIEKEEALKAGPGRGTL